MRHKHRTKFMYLLGAAVALVVSTLLVRVYHNTQEPPEGMRLVDIGSPVVPGKLFQIGGGCYEMRASGRDIWEKSDEGSFVYKPVQGDATIQLRVDYLEGGETWAKVGLMFRDSTVPDSAHVFLNILRLQEGVFIYEVIWRARQGDGSRNHRCDSAISRPFDPANDGSWLRVERRGQTVIVLTSPDGKTWNQQWTGEVSLPERYLAGVALTGRSKQGAVAVAKLCDIVLTYPTH